MSKHSESEFPIFDGIAILRFITMLHRRCIYDIHSCVPFLNRFKINLVFFINKLVGEIDLCVVKLAVNIFVTRQIPRCVSM